VIATGGVKRQLEAMSDVVDEVIAGQARLMGREGDADSGWILLDYGDLIVHLFAPHEREYYDIEGLWQEATPLVRIQ
jgi:ribosome-associated protein